MASAFTVQYNQISNRLTTPITIIGNGKQIADVALWDTGATCSCISKEIANSLDLIATGFCLVQTPSGQATQKTYLIDIELPNKVIIGNVRVTESEIGQQGLGLLIGMDVISLGDFSVSNFDGKTTFCFRIPSVEEIDFVKEDSKAVSALMQTQGPEENTSDSSLIDALH